MDTIQTLDEILKEANNYFDRLMEQTATVQESDRYLYLSAWLKHEYTRLYSKYLTLKESRHA